MEKLNHSFSERYQTRVQYRPDIDGLRAIAVGAVLLFHARLGLSGGFVGVDVFFVISGFLITSLILKDAGSPAGFSIMKFWERRIRRILPALFVVIVATLIGGWFILLPSHFQDLGKSVLAQAVFAGNFYFWWSSGYFADEAILKPLLHTWSLAVEEQFYLLFPLLFLLFSKWKLAALRWLIWLAALTSLGLSMAQTRSAPDAGFYLLPSRAWELLCGALLAMTPRGQNIPLWIRETLGWGGLLAVLFAFIRYDESTPFPGLAAIVPCVGTLMMIYVNGLAGQPSVLTRLLSVRPLVFLGAISYSLYLWHWPILVYATYWQDNSILRWFLRVGLLGLSVILAMLSWKYIEMPFRTRRVFPQRREIFTFGLTAPACCALLGWALILSHGAPSRFPAAVLRYDAARSTEAGARNLEINCNVSLDSALRGDFPRIGRTNMQPQCLVWGDSHAMAIFPVIEKLAIDSNSSVELATHTATCPILGIASSNKTSLKSDSKSWCEAVVEHVRHKQIPNVILAANWQWYFGITKQAQPNRELVEKLVATVTALQQAGAKVWIFKTVPKEPVHVRMGMEKAILKGSPGITGVTKANYLAAASLEDEIFAAAVSKGANILNPLPFFFAGRDNCLIELSGHLLYNDDNHLTPDGALLLAELFQPVFTKRADNNLMGKQ